MRPTGSTRALIPVLVERMRARRVSMARKLASARWISGSCESPYQESLVRLTRTLVGPRSAEPANERGQDVLVADGRQERQRPEPERLQALAGVNVELRGNQRRISGKVLARGIRSPNSSSSILS